MINLYGQIIDINNNDDFFIFLISENESCNKFKRLNDSIIENFGECYRILNPIQNSNCNYTNTYELKINFTYKSLVENKLINILDNESDISKLLLGKYFKIKVDFKKYKFEKNNSIIAGYKIIL